MEERCVRVMLDTDVLVSAILRPGSDEDVLLGYVLQKHRLVLFEPSIEEFRDVMWSLADRKMCYVDMFLSDIVYETIPENYRMTKSQQDRKKMTLIDAVRTSKVDVFVTGDRTYLCTPASARKCVSVKDFLRRVGAAA